MSRYLERVDSTARLVEINLLHLIETESAIAEAAEWRPLLVICGHEAAFAEVAGSREMTSSRVIEFITRERRNPGSVRHSLRLARENARVVRDRISKEMWESVNELWLRSEERLEKPPAADYYRFLRSEVARFHGLTTSSMVRGEAFGFYLLGFFLERADMTSRIIDVKYHLLLPDASMVGSPLDYYQWAALLKSMSGFEAYRRKYHQLRPLDVAEFVILDPEFPRSLRFAVDRMQQALVGVGAEPSSPSMGAVMELSRLLEKTDAAGLFEQGLHEFLGKFLARVSTLHDALQDEYFEAHLGERSCAT
ncbi:MAG: alpha-E domain-containing protein [Proteobacteria bacterium]|nr:alpha-E domain-containing protein [Pseudomonadota bacterium]